MHSWIQRLPDLFISFQLEDIHFFFGREHAWQRRMASEMACALAEEIALGAYQGQIEEQRAIRLSVEAAYAEVKEGAWISQPFNTAVGRKPA